MPCKAAHVGQLKKAHKRESLKEMDRQTMKGNSKAQKDLPKVWEFLSWSRGDNLVHF